VDYQVQHAFPAVEEVDGDEEADDAPVFGVVFWL
jgi:hypothetical protein